MNRRVWLAVVAGAAGAVAAIGVMEFFAVRTAIPLMANPFGTSIVLMLGSPEVEAVQPRALIGGHLVARLVGLVMAKITGPQPWAVALAVGLAVVAMRAIRTIHPPAGIDPRLVVVNDCPGAFSVSRSRSPRRCLRCSLMSGTRRVRRYDWPHRWQ